MTDKEQSSAGHKLGQLVGDWFQDYFAAPLLQEVADKLGLYLDHRHITRNPMVRKDKLVWKDIDSNSVDYDFVLELGGTPDQRGIPVAFFECFWRRGARHSKDKARDDSGKLLPMRATYPTARFLGIVAGGEFTRPARELVESRRINLFYIPKAKIVETFSAMAMPIDYDDKASEASKFAIADAFERALTTSAKQEAAQKLLLAISDTAIRGYIAGVQAALSSAPLEFRLIGIKQSKPLFFDSVDKMTAFLHSQNPSFDFCDSVEHFIYQIDYSDGTAFEREVTSFDELLKLHREIAVLTAHMANILSTYSQNNSCTNDGTI